MTNTQKLVQAVAKEFENYFKAWIEMKIGTEPDYEDSEVDAIRWRAVRDSAKEAFAAGYGTALTAMERKDESKIELIK